ncbi:hypothetical protein ABK040_010503 [Willaertia magna]
MKQFLSKFTSNTKTIGSNMLWRNGKVISEYDKRIDSTAFLKDFPRGAYTTMRTLHRINVFQFMFHMHRLIHTTKQMIEKEKNENSLKDDHMNHVEFIEEDGYPFSLLMNDDAQGFLAETKRMLGKSILEYSLTIDQKDLKEVIQKQDSLEGMDELKITMLLVWSTKYDRFDIYSHITKLENRPKHAITVDIRKGSRTHLANSKDSHWILERDQLLEKKSKSSNEVLMCEDDGTVREGLSSNFFIISSKDKKVITAKEGILYGTVRRLLVPTEEEIGNSENQHQTTILNEGEYIEGNPNLKDLLDWKEAFITSTSRLVLPIEKFIIEKDCIDNNENLQQNKQYLLESGKLIEENNHYIYQLPSTEQSNALYKKLFAKMQEMSCRVVDNNEF